MRVNTSNYDWNKRTCIHLCQASKESRIIWQITVNEITAPYGIAHTLVWGVYSMSVCRSEKSIGTEGSLLLPKPLEFINTLWALLSYLSSHLLLHILVGAPTLLWSSHQHPCHLSHPTSLHIPHHSCGFHGDSRLCHSMLHGLSTSRFSLTLNSIF